MKILAVDDDEGILDALSLILEDSGYTVETLSKAEEIKKKIKIFQPDTILLDVLMSGVDGRMICRELKQSSLTKQIPLIMVSAHPSAKKGAFECGADEFLAKPFSTTQLIEIIEKNRNNQLPSENS